MSLRGPGDATSNVFYEGNISDACCNSVMVRSGRECKRNMGRERLMGMIARADEEHHRGWTKLKCWLAVKGKMARHVALISGLYT